MTDDKTSTQQVNYRLSTALLRRISAYATRFAERHHLPLSQTDAVRMLLERGLEAAELEERQQVLNSNGSGKSRSR